MRQRVTAEQIKIAKSIDLINYMKQYEPMELIRTGPHDYKTASHSSLCISDNGLWHWFSHGISREATDLQLLQELPALLVQSCLALDAPDTHAAEARFLSDAVALEVCGRLGIPAPAASDTRMEQCRHILSQKNVREHFDNARDFARTMGDQIEHSLPKLQYHARDTRCQPERG